MPTIKKLDIAYCKWKALPENINLLKNLEELDAKGNSFTILPQGITQLSALKILNVGNDNSFKPTNQLTSLPCGFSVLL